MLIVFATPPPPNRGRRPQNSLPEEKLSKKVHPLKRNSSRRSGGRGFSNVPPEHRARSPTVVPFERTPSAAELITQLRNEGPVAKDGVWIETSKVPRRSFRQAFYRSRNPVFLGKRGQPVKRKYIGKVGSPAHQRAIEAIARRNKINRLKKLMQAEEGDES